MFRQLGRKTFIWMETGRMFTVWIRLFGFGFAFYKDSNGSRHFEFLPRMR